MQNFQQINGVIRKLNDKMSQATGKSHVLFIRNDDKTHQSFLINNDSVREGEFTDDQNNEELTGAKDFISALDINLNADTKTKRNNADRDYISGTMEDLFAMEDLSKTYTEDHSAYYRS